MKALQLTQNQNVESTVLPLASAPASGLVRLKMSYITLNHLDLFGYRGMAFAKRQLPLVVGAEGAGQVVAISDKSDAAWLGKSVVVYSSYFCGHCKNCLAGQENLCLDGGGIIGFHRDGLAREYVDIPATMLVEIPEGVELQDAVCAPITFSTVHQMLINNARLQAGEAILIHAGGSGIGSVAIKMAKFLGATVFTTVGSEEKVERAKALGADWVINYRQQRFLRVIREATEKRGVDVVFEHIGKETWEQSLLSLSLGGRLVTCGSTTGVEGITNLFTLFNQQLKVFGSFGAPKASLVASLQLMAKKQVLPVVDSICAIHDYASSMEKLRHRAVFGKVILKLWD